MRRHEVRPGITGWAQIHGRNMTKYSDKFKYDLWYVENISFKVDLKIFAMTIKNVLNSKDIGNGIQHEVDDLEWYKKRKWAEEQYNIKYKQ